MVDGVTRRSTLAALAGGVAPFLQNWYKGDRGTTGPANNTYFDLASFKAQPSSNGKATLVGLGEYYFETANAPYTADDVNTVKADDTPLSTGAWVRQGADKISHMREEAEAVPERVAFFINKEVPPTPFSFGAKADGVTDDTGAILTTLERTGRLILPRGTFLCDGDVITTALEEVGNVTLTGQGQESILAFGAGGLNLRGRSFRYGTLRDIHLRALGSNQTLLNLIASDSLNWPVRWNIDNIRCSSATLPAANNTGIAISGGWIGTIINPIVQGFARGIHIYPTELASPAVSFNGLNIYGGEIQGNVNGVDMAGPLNVNFFGTAIEGNRHNGALLRSGSRSVSFYGCYFEANGIDAPATTNDIRIEAAAALDTIYSALVDSGCSFLRGGVGSQTAIWANRCQELLIEEGASFNGYTNRLVVDELGANTVTGAARSRSAGSSTPIVNNSNSFGDPKSITAHMGGLAMPDDAMTPAGEIYLALPLHAGRLGSIIINYSADESGPVRFLVEPFDVATGAALTTLPVTPTAAVGRNMATSAFNLDVREMRGKTTAVRVSRDGANAADTNTGVVALQSVELRWFG